MARIVMMLNRLVIGGAPMDTVELAGYLSDHHEVYLVVGDKNNDEMDASFLADHFTALKVVHINGMRRSPNILKDLNAFRATRKLFRQIRPDIVHTHGAKSGLLGRLAAKSVGVKIILHTYHGHVFHSYFNSVVSAAIIQAERWLAGISTKIIAISEKQKNELVFKYKLCPADKMEVIKLGIDTFKFKKTTDEERNVFRSNYAIQENEIAIGIIGRIVPVKGHAFFAEVVSEIIKSSRLSIKFFVIGDGQLRKEVQQLFEDKFINTSYFPSQNKKAPVVFTSWLLEIEKVIAGLDIIVLTSLNEGTPVTLLEAQAGRRPVVATNVGGVSEVVLNAQSGFLVNYGDVKEFAEKVLLLAGDYSLRAEMGEKGQEFMQKNHTRLQQFQATEKLYIQLLEV